MQEIQARIREREREIERLSVESLSDERAASDIPEDEPQNRQAAEEATADRVEEIRQSVTDEAVRERVERLGHDGQTNGLTESGADGEEGR